MAGSLRRAENVRLISKIKVYISGSNPLSRASAQRPKRNIRVIISLVAAMSIGALALMAVDSQSFSAGPFSLASYTHLNSTEKITGNISISDTHNFQQIHITTSNASAGSIEQFAAVNDLANAKDLNYHFVVFNGIDGIDGQICATEKWLKQRLTLSNLNQQNSSAINICVVTGNYRAHPTDCQVKRTAALVESLARKLDIPINKIEYPANWQL